MSLAEIGGLLGKISLVYAVGTADPGREPSYALTLGSSPLGGKQTLGLAKIRRCLLGGKAY